MPTKYTEKDGETFPVWWKVAHIGLYATIFVLGLVNFIPFSGVNANFQGSCPLYANYTLKLVLNKSYAVTPNLGKKNEALCSFCLYTTVSSSVYAFILIWFYSLCGRGGSDDEGLPKPWRLVCPTFLLSLTFSIITLVSSVYYTNGFTTLCKTLEISPDVELCSEADTKKWIHFPNVKGFYTILMLAEATAWVISCLWILSSLILLARCCFPADFTVKQDENLDDEKVSDPENFEEVKVDKMSSKPYKYKKLPLDSDSDDDGKQNY